MALTVNNFIKTIKEMSPRERSKIRAETLINLIIQLPEDDVASLNSNNTETNSKFEDIYKKILSVTTNLESTKKSSS